MAWKIPLSLLIAALNAVIVATVAGLTLTVSLSVSLSTINRNAEEAIRNYGAAAVHSLDEVLREPHESASRIIKAFNNTQLSLVLPAEDATVSAAEGKMPRVRDNGTFINPPSGGEDYPNYGLTLQLIIDACTMEMRRTSFRTGYMFVFLVDGSFVMLSPAYPDYILVQVQYFEQHQPRPLTPQSHSVIYSTVLPGPSMKPVDWDTHGGFLRHLLVQNRSRPFSEYRTRTWEELGDEPTWGDIKVQVVDDAGGRTATYINNEVLARVGNETNSFGRVILNPGVFDIGGRLASLRMVASADNFLVDEGGLLIGASDVSEAVYVVEPNTTSRQHCTRVMKQGQYTHDLTCRLHFSESNLANGALKALAAARPGLVADALGTTDVVLAPLDVAIGMVVQLPTLSASKSHRRAVLISVLPRSAITGDLAAFQTTSILAAAAVVVVAALISGFFTFFFLRPLKVIADKMSAAARFEEVEHGPRGLTNEVANLQLAFEDMASELLRISSFVPRALLMAVGDAESEDEDESVVGASAAARPSTLVHPLKERRTASFSDSGTIRTATRSGIASGSMLHAAGPGDTRQQETLSSRIPNGLSAGNVTILAVNLRGFIRAAGSVTSSDESTATVFAKAVAHTAHTVLQTAESNRGVIDSFHGDRFFITFNANRPAVGHTSKGARTAVALKETLPRIALGLEMTAGLATGRAHVGGLGCQGLKRFVVVGPVVTQALVLERLCKLRDELLPPMAMAPVEDHSVSLGGTRSQESESVEAATGRLRKAQPNAGMCLGLGSMMLDLMVYVNMTVVDFVRLPYRRDLALVATIDSVVCATSVEDEWMYQLEEKCANGNSPTGKINDAWQALVKGDVTSAGALVNSARALASPRLMAAIEAAVEAASKGDNPAAASANDLGKFYDVALSPATAS